MESIEKTIQFWSEKLEIPSDKKDVFMRKLKAVLNKEFRKPRTKGLGGSYLEKTVTLANRTVGESLLPNLLKELGIKNDLTREAFVTRTTKTDVKYSEFRQGGQRGTL